MAGLLVLRKVSVTQSIAIIIQVAVGTHLSHFGYMAPLL